MLAYGLPAGGVRSILSRDSGARVLMRRNQGSFCLSQKQAYHDEEYISFQVF